MKKIFTVQALFLTHRVISVVVIIVLLTHLSIPKTFAADTGNKFGLNVAARDEHVDYELANYVKQDGWVVLMPDAPIYDQHQAGLVRTEIVERFFNKLGSQVNYILRAHDPRASNPEFTNDPTFPDINDPGWSTKWADFWAGIINNLPIPAGSEFYVIPWNEPNLQRECSGIGDAYNVNDCTCVPYVLDYISKLEARLDRNKVKLLSPAMAVSAPNFYSFSQCLGGGSFYNRFDGVAMDYYDFQTECGGTFCNSDARLNPDKYPELMSNIGASGKRIFIVETGLVSPGQCGPGVPDCPNFDQPGITQMICQLYNNHKNDSQLAMFSPLTYNPEKSEGNWFWDTWQTRDFYVNRGEDCSIYTEDEDGGGLIGSLLDWLMGALDRITQRQEFYHHGCASAQGDHGTNDEAFISNRTYAPWCEGVEEVPVKNPVITKTISLTFELPFFGEITIYRDVETDLHLGIEINGYKEGHAAGLTVADADGGMPDTGTTARGYFGGDPGIATDRMRYAAATYEEKLQMQDTLRNVIFPRSGIGAKLLPPRSYSRVADQWKKTDDAHKDEVAACVMRTLVSEHKGFPNHEDKCHDYIAGYVHLTSEGRAWVTCEPWAPDGVTYRKFWVSEFVCRNPNFNVPPFSRGDVNDTCTNVLGISPDGSLRVDGLIAQSNTDPTVVERIPIVGEDALYASFGLWRNCMPNARIEDLGAMGRVCTTNRHQDPPQPTEPIQPPNCAKFTLSWPNSFDWWSTRASNALSPRAVIEAKKAMLAAGDNLFDGTELAKATGHGKYNRDYVPGPFWTGIHSKQHWASESAVPFIFNYTAGAHTSRGQVLQAVSSPVPSPSPSPSPITEERPHTFTRDGNVYIPKPKEFFQMAADITLPDTGLIPMLLPPREAKQLAGDTAFSNTKQVAGGVNSETSDVLQATSTTGLYDMPQILDFKCHDDGSCEADTVTPYWGSICRYGACGGNWGEAVITDIIKPSNMDDVGQSASKMLYDLAKKRDQLWQSTTYQPQSVWIQLASFHDPYNSNLSHSL